MKEGRSQEKREIFLKKLTARNTNGTTMPQPLPWYEYQKRREEAFQFTKDKRIRRFIYLRDGPVCRHCGIRGVRMALDHILPVYWGGEDTLDNLQLLCFDCNKRKRASLEHELDYPIISREKYEELTSDYVVRHSFDRPVTRAELWCYEEGYEGDDQDQDDA